MADLSINIRANIRQAQRQISALQTQIQQANQAASQVADRPASGKVDTSSGKAQVAAANREAAQVEAIHKQSAAKVAAIDSKANQQAELRTATHNAKEERLNQAAADKRVMQEQITGTRVANMNKKAEATIQTQHNASLASQERAEKLNAARIEGVRQATAQRAVQAKIKENSMVAAAEQQATINSIRATEQKALSNDRMTVSENRAATSSVQAQTRQSLAHAQAADGIAISEAKKQSWIARTSVATAAAEQRAMASIARSQLSYEKSMLGLDALAQQTSNSFIRSMQNIGRAGNNIQWTGRQLESNFTIPLGIAGAAAGYFALQSESAMVRVRKIYGDASMSTQQLTNETEALERASHALGATYGQSVSVVQDTMADWIATGASGAAAFRATELSLKTALLGEMELAAATESLISIQGQYNLSTKEMAAAVDTLNMAEQNAGAKYGDYIEAMEKSAGTARSAGIDIAHLTAMVSSLVPAAGSAAQAGNSLKTIFSRLLSPTREAAQVMGMMGVNTEDAAWKSMTGAERLEHMAQKYVELAENVKGAGETSEETGKKISSQAVVVSKTVASTWQISRFETLMRDLADENGRYATVLKAVSDEGANAQQSQRELNAILDSTPMTLKQIGVYMQGYLIDMIKPLLPVVVSLAATVATLVAQFAQLPYPIQAVVIGGLALLAVFGPIAKYLGSFISLFGVVGGVAKMLGSAFGLAGDKIAGTSADLAVADSAVNTNTRMLQINAAQAAATARAHEAASAQVARADGIMAASAAAPAGGKTKATGAAAEAAASSALPTAIIAKNAKKAEEAYGSLGKQASKTAKDVAKPGAAATRSTGILARIGPRIVSAFTSPWGIAIGIVVGAVALFWDQIVIFFQSMTNQIAKSWSTLPNAIRKPLENVVGMVRDAALAVYDWFSYLNPWAHHSPSLVEQVTSGMAEVQRQYGFVGNVGKPFMQAAKDLKAFKSAVSALPSAKAEAAAPRMAIVSAKDSKALAMYDKMGRTLDSLNRKQEALNLRVAKQQAVVNSWAAALDRANGALDRQQSKLDSLSKAHDALNDRLSAAQEKLSEYTNAPIKGLGKMEDAIFANEQAQKKLQLELAKMGDMDEYKKAADQVAELQGEIETLTGRRSELYSKGAGSDILGPIDKQIENLRKQQGETGKAADGAVAKAKKLEDELKKLQDRAQIMDLEKSLKFDGLQRAIDKTANSAKELTFAEIIAGIKKQKDAINALQPKVDAANRAMEKQQSVVDGATAARDRIQKSYDAEQKKLEKLNNTYESTAKLIGEIEDAMSNLSSTVDKAAKDEAQKIADKAQKAAQKKADAKAKADAAKAAKKAKEAKVKAPKAESLSPGAKNFMDAAGGGYDDPGGISNLGREGGLGDQSAEIDKLTDEMNQNLIDKFAKLDMFGPIRQSWGKFKDWMGGTLNPAFATAGKSVGDAFINSLKWIGDQQWLFDIGENIKRFFSDVFGGDALRGTNLDGLGKSFENAMDAIKRGWDKFADGDLGKQMKDLWQSIKDLGKALLPVLAVIGVVIGAVAAVIGGALAVVWGALMGFLPPLIEYIGVIIGVIVGIISGLVKILVGVISGIVSFVSGVINVIVAVFQMIWGILTGNQELMQEAKDRMVEGLTQMLDGVIQIFEGLWEGAKDIFGSIFDLIIGTLKFLVTGAVGIVSGMVNAVINWFKWLWDVLVGHSIIPDTVNAIIEWFQSLWDKGIELIAGLVNGVIDWFTDLWTDTVTAVTNFYNGVVNWFGDTKDKAVAIAKLIKDGVVNKFIELKTAAVDKVKALGTGALNAFKNAKKWLGDKAEEIRKGVVDKYEKMRDKGVAKAKALGTGALSKFKDAKKWLKDKAEETRKAVVDKYEKMREKGVAKSKALGTGALSKFKDAKKWLKDKAEETRKAVVDKYEKMREKGVAKSKALGTGALSKFKDTKKWLKDKSEEIRKSVSGKFKDMKDNVLKWAGKMRDGIKTPIKKFANNLRSPINLAIKAVRTLINGLNKIPKHLPGLNWSIGKPSYVPKFEMGTENIPTMRVGSGKTVSNARAIVGEGNTNHKEYVVPTDPKHRDRARMLHRKLGQDLGVPMYAKGGILDKVGNVAKGATSKVKDTVGNVWGGMKNFGSAALKNLKKVGTVGKGLLSDSAKWVTKHASNAMSWLLSPLTKRLKEKVSDIFPGERGMVPRKVGHWAVDKLNSWGKEKDSFFSKLAEHIQAESGGGDYAGGNGKGYKWQMQVLRSRFKGLRMNSGPRPGARTTSGNTSYHSRGLAVDVPPRKDVFNFIARNFPGTAELIFSPMGRRQIKNGRSHVYSGAVKAMHYNHVHWAYTGKGMRKGFAAPGNVAGGPKGVKKYAKWYANKAYGWKGAQWNNIDWLVNRESSWNPRAQNPRSTAYGLFQFLNGTWGPYGRKTSNYKKQIQYGYRYIRDRYKSPSGARRFHQSHGWYGAGGDIKDPSTGQIPAMLANGGIVKSRLGGTPAIVGEGKRDEAVFQLPAGWQQSFNEFGSLSNDIVVMRDAANTILAASKGSMRSGGDADGGTTITNVTYNTSSETNVYVTGDLSFPNVKNGDDVSDLIEALKAVAKD